MLNIPAKFGNGRRQIWELVKLTVTRVSDERPFELFYEKITEFLLKQE